MNEHQIKASAEGYAARAWGKRKETIAKVIAEAIRDAYQRGRQDERFGRPDHAMPKPEQP